MISDSQIQFLAHTVIQCAEPVRKQFIVHLRALAKGHYDSAVLIPANASDFLESLAVFNREIIRLSSPEAEVCNTDNNASTVLDMCVCVASCSLCTVICPSRAYQCPL